MPGKIKFLYFDLGGVFFHWKHFPQVFSQRFGNTPQNWQRVFDKYDTPACLGKMTPPELWQKFQQELNFRADPSLDFTDLWSDFYIPIPKTAKLVTELSSVYKIGILSDIFQGIFAKYIPKGIIPDLPYSPVIESCNVGFRKPHLEIFNFALTKSGYKAEEILFIDDNSVNTAAAQKLGWNTVTFDEWQPKKSIAEIKAKLV